MEIRPIKTEADYEVTLKGKVYEILARKRPLTLRMIEGLHETFSIPAESLLKRSSQSGSHAA